MGLSSFLEGRALFQKRDRSQVKPHGHKQLFRFKRIRCTKSFTSPNNHQKKEFTTPGKRVPAFDVVCCCTSLSSSEKRTFLIVRNGCQHEERQLPGKFKGRQEPRDIAKRWKNRKADGFTLLRQITRLKCVNSVVKSVLIHPSLTWLHGIMSESPWKSH